MSNPGKPSLSRRQFLKIGSLGIAAAGVSVLLESCGGNPPTPIPPAATAAPSGGSAPAAYKFPSTGKPYAGAQLNVSMVAEPKPLKLKTLVPEFEQLTGIKVNFEDMPYPTLQEKQLTSITQGNNAYDIVHVDCVWMGQYAGQGWLTQVDDLAAQTDPKYLDLADFVPRLTQELDYWDGKLYGLPFDTSVMMFYYRTDLFEKYGLKAPTTWDEVLQAATKITEGEKANDVYGITLMAKRSVQLGCTYGNLLGAYGGYYYDKNYKATMNSPEAIQALEMLKKLVDQANPGALAQDYDEGDAAFAGGSAAMFLQWNDSIPRYNNPDNSKIIGKWAAAPMPGVKMPDGKIRQSPTIGGWNTGILAESKNKEAAWEFLLWAVSKEMEHKLADAQPPARSSVLSEPDMVAKYPEYGPMLDTLKVAWGRPRIPVWPQMTDNIEAALSQAVTGELSPADALNKVNPILDETLKTAGLQK